MTQAYDAAGNILSVQQPGSTSAFTHNAKGLPVMVQYRFDDGASMDESFTYDALGRITGTKRSGNKPELTKDAAYSYDPLGRLLSMKEGTITESYGYDRRGNLTEEKLGDRLIRQYLYDAAGHMCQGKNLESGEQTEYGYNALSMRVRNVQTLQNRADGSTGYAGNDGSIPQSFFTKDTSYVNDFLSRTNNELMAYETGFGAVRTVFGRGYEQLSQKITPESGTAQATRSAASLVGDGKSFFQSDLYGSQLFAANEQGGILRYAERNIWGSLKLPQQGEGNTAGLEDSHRFTAYGYDSTIDKYFAKARFYDAAQGRILGRDPIKRGLNAYPYCNDDPVNYVDPTGESANILIGGFLGGVIGGAAGFAGSAISQVVINHQKFSMSKARGAAVNGAVVGAVRGALVDSGVGIVGSLAANFAAGTAGSILEQKIGTGHVNFGDSLVSGLTNAVSGAIYGNSALKSAASAFGRGAATAGINSLYNAWKNRGRGQRSSLGSASLGVEGIAGISPYARWYDPRSGCGSPSPFGGRIGYRKAYGYRYKTTKTSRTKANRRKSFSLADFGKEVLLGAVLGGVSSTVFYGTGKAAEFLNGRIRSNRVAQQQNIIIRTEVQYGHPIEDLKENQRLKH